MESSLANLRGKQDLGNSVVAASVTGALYKSTGICPHFIYIASRVCTVIGGTRAMLVAAGLGCVVIGCLHASKMILGQNGAPATIFDYT